MQVQMEDSLSGVRTDVINRAKAVFQIALACDFCRDELAVADQLCIGLGRLVDADNMLFGDDQNMRRRSRFDIFKDENLVVFVNFFRRNAAGDNLAEKAVSHSKEILANIALSG